MDDTRLIVEVEKQKVIYDPKNVMYKDLQAKEKAYTKWQTNKYIFKYVT